MGVHTFCKLVLLLLGVVGINSLSNEIEEDNSEVLDRFKVEGFVEKPMNLRQSDEEYFASALIYTNTGFQAFLRDNGSFVLHNLPWGSHFIHVVTPNIMYPAVRVDINAKGKWRPRKVNILQPSKVEVMSMPMKISPLGPVRYFQAREQWRITDMLFNPMVLMTVLPLALMLLMPKMSDPETRREVEAQFQMPKTETPDLSEMMTNLLGGGFDKQRSVRGTGGAGGSAAGSRGGRRKEK